MAEKQRRCASWCLGAFVNGVLNLPPGVPIVSFFHAPQSALCYNERMFGYIVPFVPELKVRELEQFRGYYCGLCRTLKAQYGKIGVLNYDATFLYMLLDGLEEKMPQVRRAKCAVHPFSARGVLLGSHAEYAADVNILMAWAKAEDDCADEGGVRAGVHRSLLKAAYQRAEKRIPQATERMVRSREALDRIEKENSDMVDAACHPYADLLGEIFADGYVLKSHILRDLGYNLGRWVYMIDALDDMDEDAEAGRYNVFVNRARQLGQTTAQIRGDARFSLFYTLSQAQQALTRLQLTKNGEILNNIITLGLRRQTDSVLAGQGKLDESIRRARGI